MSSTNSLEDLSKEKRPQPLGPQELLAGWKLSGWSLCFVSSDSRSARRGTTPTGDVMQQPKEEGLRGNWGTGNPTRTSPVCYLCTGQAAARFLSVDLRTVPVRGSSPAFLLLSRESDQGSEPTPHLHGRGISEQCRLLAITVLG